MPNRETHTCLAQCSARGICQIDVVPQSILATFTGRHDTFQYTKVFYSSVVIRHYFLFRFFLVSSIFKVSWESTTVASCWPWTTRSCEKVAMHYYYSERANLAWRTTYPYQAWGQEVVPLLRRSVSDLVILCPRAYLPQYSCKSCDYYCTLRLGNLLLRKLQQMLITDFWYV